MQQIMKKSILLSVLILIAVVVCGRSIIMKIEMKDGTNRFLDTEQIDEFNFLVLDEIPEKPVDRYITEDLYTGALWLHDSTCVFSGTDRNVLVTDRYIPNDPIEHEYTIYGWGNNCRKIKFYLDEGNNLRVPCQSTGFSHPTYGPIWVADFNHYYSEVNFKPVHDARKCSFDGSYFNLYLVYYAPEYNDGTEFAQTATETILSPNAQCMTLSASLPSKTGDEFVWDITLTDRFGFLRYAMLDYAWITDDFYSSDKANNFIENFPSNATKIEFNNGIAHFTVKSDRLQSQCLFLAHLYDKDGIMLNENEADLFRYPMELSMGLEFAPDHEITWGMMTMDFISADFVAYLSYVAPDEAVGVERHLVLNMEPLRDIFPNYKFNIYFPEGITPDENGHIPVSIRPHDTGYKLYSTDNPDLTMFVATQDQLVEKYDYTLDVHQSYYDINRNELMLYNVYYSEDPLRFISFGNTPDFFSRDRTRDDALSTPVDDEWEAYTTGQFIDGWISARYTYTNNEDGSTVDYSELPSDVEIERNKENPFLFRMKNPWSSPESFAMQIGFNLAPENAYIVIDCSDPNFVIIDPQYSGCSITMSSASSDLTKIEIGNYAYMLGEELEDGSLVTKELLIEKGLNTTFKDGVVCVPKGACLFGYDGVFGYKWVNDKSEPIGMSLIYLGSPDNDKQLKTRKYTEKLVATISEYKIDIAESGTIKRPNLIPKPLIPQILK